MHFNQIYFQKEKYLPKLKEELCKDDEQNSNNLIIELV